MTRELVHRTTVAYAADRDALEHEFRKELQDGWGEPAEAIVDVLNLVDVMVAIAPAAGRALDPS